MPKTFLYIACYFQILPSHLNTWPISGCRQNWGSFFYKLTRNPYPNLLTRTPISLHYQTLPHLYTLLKTLGFCPKLKNCPQPARAQKLLKFVSQSESKITSPKSTREFSSRVEIHSRLSVPLGLPCFILIHGDFHSVTSFHSSATNMTLLHFYLMLLLATELSLRPFLLW